VLQVIDDPLDHHQVFDAGNQLHQTTAFSAGVDIDVVNTLEPLCPCYLNTSFGGCLILRDICKLSVIAFAAFPRATRAEEG